MGIKEKREKFWKPFLEEESIKNEFGSARESIEKEYGITLISHEIEALEKITKNVRGRMVKE